MQIATAMQAHMQAKNHKLVSQTPQAPPDDMDLEEAHDVYDSDDNGIKWN